MHNFLIYKFYLLFFLETKIIDNEFHLEHLKNLTILTYFIITIFIFFKTKILILKN
jgi:hypothetical protein